MRDDLPELARRRLEWGRRKACSDMGRMYDALLDAHVNPEVWLMEVRQLHARHLGGGTIGEVA